MLGFISTIDMPDKIVARQTKDQTRFQGEDSVSFSLDPFYTHQFSDRNFFIVNPLGTKYAHLATGRAEKSEWIGLWKTAAEIYTDLTNSSTLGASLIWMLGLTSSAR